MKLHHLAVGLGLLATVIVTGIVGVRRFQIRPSAAATLVQPAGPIKVHADGRVVARPGAQATLSAEISGRLVAVNVVEGQAVKKGDVLAVFDHREYDAMLAEANGSANEAFARVKGRRDDARRTKSLIASGSISRQDGDRIREERRAAEGRLVASNAAFSRARVLIDKARIVAPFDGVVISRMVEPAETVPTGTPLFVVADLSARRVEAEVDEFDVGRVASGAAADVTADGFPGAVFHGEVVEIPDVVAPRRLRSADPARPTDSAVLLVKVSLPADSPLKLGQRVGVTIEGAVASHAAGAPQ